MFTGAGLKPDSCKISAIINMGIPRDKKELQTILGMITYVGKFVSNLSDVTYKMRQLLKSKIEFLWSKKHDQDFIKL